MSSLIDYARKELARIPHDDTGLQDQVDRCILDVISVFCSQGHSNSSALYVIHTLERLLRFLPLQPLTGEDDEWTEIADGKFQNKRCSRVFKDENGAYDIEGRVFSDDGGRSWHQNRDSRIPVTFPYTPPTKPERIYVDPR